MTFKLENSQVFIILSRINLFNICYSSISFNTKPCILIYFISGYYSTLSYFETLIYSFTVSSFLLLDITNRSQENTWTLSMIKTQMGQPDKNVILETTWAPLYQFTHTSKVIFTFFFFCEKFLSIQIDEIKARSTFESGIKDDITFLLSPSFPLFWPCLVRTSVRFFQVPNNF